jgi:type IV pilus assembly protein PilM
MPKKAWGIDISKTSIKAVQMISDGGGLTVTAMDVEELPRGGTDQTQIETHIREGLSALMSRNRIKGQSIACSLPGHAVFNRPVKLPPGDPSRIGERVKYEAQQQIPFPLNEVIWDSYLVDRKYAVGEEMEVILFAIKRDVVDHFIESLRSVGISPEVIQFSPVALYNYLVHDQDVGNASIALDLGADNTDLVVVDGPHCWIRNLPVAGNDLTKALHKELNIPLAEAEKMKVTAASSQQQGKLFAAMQPVLKDLVGEIHRSIGYYKSISRLNKFDKIFLLGNGAKTIHLGKFISQNLQLDATKVDRLAKISVASSVDQTKLSTYLDTLGPALGLALQAHGLSRMNINLLPEEELRRMESARRRPAAIAAVVLLAVPVYMMWNRIQGDLAELGKSKATATAVLKKHGQMTDDLKRAKDPIEPIQKELATLGNIVTERDLSIKILDRINKTFKNTETLQPQDRMWLLRSDMVNKAAKGEPAAAGAPAAGARLWISPADSVQELKIEGAILVSPARNTTQQALDFISQRLGEIQKSFNTPKPSVNIETEPITRLEPKDRRAKGTGSEETPAHKFFAFTATWDIKVGEEVRKPAPPPPPPPAGGAKK